MLHGRRWLALVLAFVVALPLLGQEKDPKKPDSTEKKPDAKDKVALKWKFEKGKNFYQTMNTETSQTMKVMNNEVKQTQKQKFYFQYTVGDQTGDNVVLTQKIIGVVMNIDIGGSKIDYDSTAPNPAGAPQNPLSDFFKQLISTEFKLTLDTKALKVTKVDGQKEFLEKLVKANPQMKPLLEQILSDKALIEMAEPTFAVIPTEPKAPGENWTRKTTLDMGPIGKYENEYKYTFEGQDASSKDYKIKTETTLKYTPPSDQAAAGVGGLPFKIKSADLKSSNATGSILFNNEKGRVAKSDMSLDLSGSLSIEIGGTTTKVDLSQTQKTTVESSDDDPLKPKKPA
jgi:hypothetical protein